VRLVLLFFAAGLIALSLQTGALHWLPLGGLVPDLMLILAVDLGMRHASVLGAVIAFALGYATDAFSGSQMGLNAFMLTLVFVISYQIARQLMVAGDLVGSITVFLAVLINDVGTFAMTSGLPGIRRGGTEILELAMIQAVVTALLAPTVFSLLSRGKKALGLPQRKARE
jgi:rod shape-determining protein MreD